MKNDRGTGTIENMVVIVMQNPNALIAMALISHNANNPYTVFCEYIKYCIYANAEDTMTLPEIRNAVGDEFGLFLPYNVAIKCLSQIQNERDVIWDNHQIKRIGRFDLERFEQRRAEYRTVETSVINALIRYVEKYGRTWSSEYAREQLIKVLDRNGLAYDIFLHSNMLHNNDNQSNTNSAVIEELMVDDNAIEEDDPEKQPLFSDSFFVGRFIEETIATETIQKEYLQKICEGLMLCVGAYQLPSSDVDSASLRINGTGFFFDTRLLLRFLGCAGEAAVEAVNELVNLIQGAGGNIYYYPQTLEEMNRAFDDAIRSLSCGYPPRDEEMRLYAVRVKNSITVISAKKASLENELSKANIYLRQREYFSEADRIHFGFDCSDLQRYMENQLPWDQKTIENDALSIWETHMRRQGNYSAYCGTSACLPVFVTSNSRLIGIALKYRDERQNTRNISHWKSNRLPVITDIRLTCRLWSPAIQSERLSLLYLTSNAVAAQRPTRRYLNTIRTLALELEKTVPEYSSIPLPAFFDDNVTDVVLENTQGLEENLNAGIFASSIAELSEWKAREQEEITNKVKKERDQTSERLDEQTSAIIEGAVDNNKNRLGWRGILLKLILNWPIVVTILFAGITALISYLIGNWSPMWLIVVPILLSGIEHFISSHFIVKLLLKYTLPMIEHSFEKKIVRKLRKAENSYADEIVRLTKEQTKLLEKAKSMLHD